MKPNPPKTSEPVTMKKPRELESSSDNDINIEFGSSPKQRSFTLNTVNKNPPSETSFLKINDYAKLASSPVFMVPPSGIISSSAGSSSTGGNKLQNQQNIPHQSFSKQLSKSQTDLNSSHDYGFKPSSVPTRGNYAQRINTSSVYNLKQNSDDNLSSVSSVSPPVRDFGMDFLFHLQAMRSSRSSFSQNSQTTQTKHNFKYLVLEGGGVKGIALVGALSELYKLGEIRSITHITGSSVGALIGSLVACRIPYDQLEKYINGLDFSKFRDSSWNPFKNIYNIQRKCGWYQGNELYEEHGNILRAIRDNKAENPADITFQEVHNLFGTTLVIPVTLVYKQGCISINCSRANFPNMPIRLASRYSASFPLWFEALPFLGTLTTDGGLLNNYPVDVFAEYPDFISRGIGLKLVASHEIRTLRNKIGETIPSRHLSGQTDVLGGAPNNAEEFTYSIVGAIYDNAQMMHIPPYANELTVNIDTGHVSSMNFNIPSVDKMMLFEKGKDAIVEFLRARRPSCPTELDSPRVSIGENGSRLSSVSIYSSNSDTKNKKDEPENVLDDMQFLDLHTK